MLNRLGQMNYPIPRPLREAASGSLDLQLRQELGRLGDDGSLARLQGVYERARAWGYQPDRGALEQTISRTVEKILSGLDPDADLPSLVAHAGLLVDAAALLGLSPDLWQAQNQLLDAFVQLTDSGAMTQPLRDVFSDLVTKLNFGHELLEWRP
jgi:hypothetical protein